MNWIKLVVSLAISFSAAAIGSLATTPNIPTWYAVIEKPFFTPPNWVFGPVWSFLYLLIGISLYLIWTHNDQLSKRTAYILFGLQMILNTAWSLVFFGLQMPWAGMAIILLLDIAVIATLIRFYRIHKIAGLLLIPYLAWIVFATFLNSGIAILN